MATPALTSLASASGSGAVSNSVGGFISANPIATYLGPLTTIFTPPSTCSGITTSWDQYGVVIFHGEYGDPKCYPGDVGILDQQFSLYYWSPGVCPSGFTLACQAEGTWSVGVTASLCCPTGYFCGHLDEADSPNNIAPNCVRTVTTTLTSVWIGTGTNPTGVPSDASFTTVDPPQTIFMNGVPVAWMSSDDAVLARASAALSTTSSTSTAASPTTPVSSSPTPLTNGLSTGAKAGIGVGVSIGVLAALLGAFFLYSRSRGKLSKKSKEVNEEYRKAELPDDAHRVFPVELEGHSNAELDGQPKPQELSSDSVGQGR